MRQRSSLDRLIPLGIVLAITFSMSLGPLAEAIAGQAPSARPLPAAAGQLLDARAYAADYNVSLREAQRRLRAQDQMSGVVDLLRRATGRRFAGLWIEHQPKFRLVVRMVGKDLVPAGLKAAVASSPIPVTFQAGALASQANLLGRLHASLPDLLSTLPNMDGTDVDVRTGDIVLTVHAVGAERDEVLAKVPALAKLLGAPVRINFNELAEQDQSVRGGGTLTDCTSGFVVANSAGTRGFTTAAHCGNSEFYSDFDGTNTSSTFVSELQDATHDVQWHTTPQTEVPEFYADLTSSARVLTGRRLLSSTSVGNTVCHRGITSGYSCGSVESTTYQPTYAGACGAVACSSVYVKVSGASLACAGGDSGGPWFNGQTAFGTHKSGASSGSAAGQCSYATYTSTDYLSGLGVSLVYGP